MTGPELARYWDQESEDNIQILKQLQKEGVKPGQWAAVGAQLTKRPSGRLGRRAFVFRKVSPGDPRA